LNSPQANRVKEHAYDKFTTLSELADGYVTFYQSSITQELTKRVELELKLAKDAFNKHFCTSVAALGIAMAIHHPNVEMANSKDLITLVFEEDLATLLKHSEITTTQELLTLSKSPPTTPSQLINSPCSPWSNTAAYSLPLNPTPTF
jgi:hypothetical protein